MRSSSWILSLLAFAAVTNNEHTFVQARELQGDTDTEAAPAVVAETAPTTTTEEATTSDTTAATTADAVSTPTTTAGETTTTSESTTTDGATTSEAVTAESQALLDEEEKKAQFNPGGTPTRDHQGIFEQGAYNWDGSAVVEPIKSSINLETEAVEVTDINDTLSILDGQFANEVVQLKDHLVTGRIDGQTGWSGLDVNGKKTISYRFTIVVWSNQGLKRVFDVDRPVGQASQLGWWVPARGAGESPENWVMSLADIYLKSSDVKASTIEMRQTKWSKGLRTQVGVSVDGYVDQFDTQQNVSTWTFDRSTGFLNTYSDNASTRKTKDDYFVPVPDLTRIETNRLVLGFEGSNFKLNLPDVRGSTKIPVRFQITDYVTDLPGLMLRQKFDVELIWADDPNACTWPGDCKIEEEVSADDAAFNSLTTTLSATVFAVATLLAF